MTNPADHLGCSEGIPGNRGVRPHTFARGPPAHRCTIDREKTNEKSGGKTDNVPFNVRPGSEMAFELGQVSHSDLIFVCVEAAVERSRIGIWFGV